MGDAMGGLGLILGLVLVIWLYFGLPASMAAVRGRSVLGWTLLTLMFSPVFTIIALMVLGPTIETVLARRQRR